MPVSSTPDESFPARNHVTGVTEPEDFFPARGGQDCGRASASWAPLPKGTASAYSTAPSLTDQACRCTGVGCVQPGKTAPPLFLQVRHTGLCVSRMSHSRPFALPHPPKVRFAYLLFQPARLVALSCGGMLCVSRVQVCTGCHNRMSHTRDAAPLCL